MQAHNLSADELKAREVVHIDIANDKEFLNAADIEYVIEVALQR